MHQTELVDELSGKHGHISRGVQLSRHVANRCISSWLRERDVNERGGWLDLPVVAVASHPDGRRTVRGDGILTTSGGWSDTSPT